MSSSRVLEQPQREALRSKGAVVPLFVCPGVRDVPIDYAIFPYGSGCTEPFACPGRDICQWYAAHDLGGEVEFSDLPEESQLSAQFVSGPFSCPNFHEHRGCRKLFRRAKTTATTPQRVKKVARRG